MSSYLFTLNSDGCQDKTEIASFTPEELFGTKLRALLQRSKNHDLFDLYHGLEQLALNTGKLLACFEHYLALSDKPISRAVASASRTEPRRRAFLCHRPASADFCALRYCSSRATTVSYSP